jgi:hypothetical protein
MPSFPNPEDIKKVLGMGRKTPAPTQTSGPLRKIAKLPANEQARMEKALKELMDKRAKAVKKTGVYPNYNTN